MFRRDEECTSSSLHYVESVDARADDRRIGVLYLDSRERGTLGKRTTQAALEALASEASVAIENARLYREKLEKARLEGEMRVAAEIQQALMPRPLVRFGFAEAAASAVACRSIGGDFFDYVDEDGAAFGFTLGDVAGKGPPAALLSALMHGMFAMHAGTLTSPADTVRQFNEALCRRGIESRFVTIVLGRLEASGRLTYCNGGHNPPFIIGAGGVRRLDKGGPVIGLLSQAAYEQDTVQLEPGDIVIAFSDGVSEALSLAGEEFGDARLLDAARGSAHLPVDEQVDRIVAAVRAFTTGAPQSDDITVMVVRYLGVASAG